MRDATTRGMQAAGVVLALTALAILLQGCGHRPAVPSVHRCRTADCCDWKQQNARWVRSVK